MNVDGGSYSSPGRVYLKQSDYHDEVAMNQAWSELEKLVRGNYRPPEHLCLDKIKQCIALLKPPVSNDPKQ
jgi:hypothetical protein